MGILSILSIVWKFAAGFFATVFNFCKQPPGSYLALIALIFIAYWYSGQVGYNRGTTDCKAAYTEASGKEASRQKTVGEVVSKDSDKRTSEAKVQDVKNQGITHDAVLIIRSKPIIECISADAADKLRSIH